MYVCVSDTHTFIDNILDVIELGSYNKDLN